MELALAIIPKSIAYKIADLKQISVASVSALDVIERYPPKSEKDYHAGHQYQQQLKDSP